MTESPEQSDQLPEEAPADHVPDDTGRPEGNEESPGADGEYRTATGNPDAAGARDEDEEDSSGD